MKIHTDNLTRRELHQALGEVDYLLDLEVTEHGSRKRSHAFDVSLTWTGEKVKGDGRGRKNYGTRGGGFEMPFAATWDEWGEWIAKLFEIDPDAIIGQYNGYEDFIEQTTRDKEWASRGKAKAPWLEVSS